MNAKQGLTDMGTSHDVGRTTGNMNMPDFSEKQNRRGIDRMQISGYPLIPEVAKTKYKIFVNRFFRDHVKLVEHEKCDLCLNDVTYFMNLLESTVEHYHFND